MVWVQQEEDVVEVFVASQLANIAVNSLPTNVVLQTQLTGQDCIDECVNVKSIDDDCVDITSDVMMEVFLMSDIDRELEVASDIERDLEVC